jgi:hypothetical protein
VAGADAQGSRSVWEASVVPINREQLAERNPNRRGDDACLFTEEKTLISEIRAYRDENGRPRIPASASLTRLVVSDPQEKSDTSLLAVFVAEPLATVLIEIDSYVYRTT